MDPELLLSRLTDGKHEGLVQDFVAYRDSAIAALVDKGSSDVPSSKGKGRQAAVKLGNFFLKALSACNTRVTQACSAQTPKPKRPIPLASGHAGKDRDSHDWAVLELARSSPFPRISSADGPKRQGAEATILQIAVAAAQGLDALTGHLVNGQQLVLTSRARLAKMFQTAEWHEEAQAEALRLFLVISRDQPNQGKGSAPDEDRTKSSAQAGRRKAGRADGTHLPLQEQEPAVFLRPPRGDDPEQLCILVVNLLQTLLYSCRATANSSARAFSAPVVAIVQQAVPFLLLNPDDVRAHSGENLARLLLSISCDVAEAEGARASGLGCKLAEGALQPALALFKEAFSFARRFGTLQEAARVVPLIVKKLGSHFTVIADIYECALKQETATLQGDGLAAWEQWVLLQLASRYTMKAYEGYFEGRAEMFLWKLQDDNKLPEDVRAFLKLLVVVIKLGRSANSGVVGEPDSKIAASAGPATAAVLQQIKQLLRTKGGSPAECEKADGGHTAAQTPGKQQSGSGTSRESQTPADLWLSSVAVALGSVAFIVDDASVKLCKTAVARLGNSEDKGQAIWDGSNSRQQAEVAAAVGGTSTMEVLQELLVEMFCVVQPLQKATAQGDSQGARGQISSLAAASATAVRLAAIGLGSLEAVGQIICSRIPGKGAPPEVLLHLHNAPPPIYKLGVSFASAGQYSQAAALLGIALDMCDRTLEAAAPALWTAAATAHPGQASARAAMQQLQQASQWYTLIANCWRTAGRLAEYMMRTKDVKAAERVLESSLRRWWWCAAPLGADRSAEGGSVKPLDLGPLHRLGYDWGEVQATKARDGLEARYIHDLLLDGVWPPAAPGAEAKKGAGKGKARRHNPTTDSARHTELAEQDPLEAHGASAVGRLMEEELRAYERDAYFHPQAGTAAQAAVLQALSQRVYAAGRCPLGKARALLDRGRVLHASFAEQPAAPGADQRLPHLQSLDEAILMLDEWMQRQPSGSEPLSKPSEEDKQRRAKGVPGLIAGAQGPGPTPSSQHEGLSLMAAALCTRGLLQREAGKDCEGAVSDIARSLSMWARLCERGGKGSMPLPAPALGGFQTLLVAATDLLRLQGASSLPQALWVAARLHMPRPAKSGAPLVSSAPAPTAGPATGWMQGYSHASHALCQTFSQGMWGGPGAHSREEECLAALIPIKGRLLPRAETVVQQSNLKFNLAWAAFSRNDTVKALHWAREVLRWRFTLVCHILTEQSRKALLDRKGGKTGAAGPGQGDPATTSFASAVGSGASALSGHSSYETASQHSNDSSASQTTAASGESGPAEDSKPGAGPMAVALTAKQDAVLRMVPSALALGGAKAQSTKAAEGQEGGSEATKAPDANQWQIIGDYLESLYQAGTIAESMGDSDEARRTLLEGLLITSGLQLHYGTLVFASALGQVFRRLQQWEEAEKHLNTAREALRALTGNDSGDVQADQNKPGHTGGLCCCTCLQLAAARLAVCQGDLARRRSTARWWQTGFLSSRSVAKDEGEEPEGAGDNEASSQAPTVHPRGLSAPAAGAGPSAPRESIVAAYQRAESILCALVPAAPKAVSRFYELAQRAAAVGVEEDEWGSAEESPEEEEAFGEEAAAGGGSGQEAGGAPLTLGEPLPSPSGVEGQGEGSSGEAEVGELCIQLEKRFEEEKDLEAKGKGRGRGRGKRDASDDNSGGGSGDSWETASVASVSSVAPHKLGTHGTALPKQAAGRGVRGAKAQKQTAPAPTAKRPSRVAKVVPEEGETGAAGPIQDSMPGRSRRSSGRAIGNSPASSIGEGQKVPSARKPPSRARRGSRQAPQQQATLQAQDQSDSSGGEEVQKTAKRVVKGAAKGPSATTRGRPQASAKPAQKAGARGARTQQAVVVLSSSGSSGESCATTPAPGRQRTGAGVAESGNSSAGQEEEEGIRYQRPKSSIKGAKARHVVSSSGEESDTESEVDGRRAGALRPVPVNVQTQPGTRRGQASKGGGKPTTRAARAAPVVNDVESSEESAHEVCTSARVSPECSPVPQTGQKSTGKRKVKRVVSSSEEGGSDDDTGSLLTLGRPTAARGTTRRASTRAGARGAVGAPQGRTARPRNSQRHSLGEEVEVARAGPEELGVERQRDMGMPLARIAAERLGGHGFGEDRGAGGLGEWAQWAGLTDAGTRGEGGVMDGLGGAGDGAGWPVGGPQGTLAAVDMKAVLPFLSETGLAGGRGCIPWGWTCAAAQQLAHCLLQQAKLRMSSGQLGQAVVCALRAFSALHRASAAAVAASCRDAGHTNSSHTCTCSSDCSTSTTAAGATTGSKPAHGHNTRRPCMCCCSCCSSPPAGEASRKHSQGAVCAFGALEAEGALHRAAAAIPACTLRPEFAALHAAVLLTLARVVLRASASATGAGRKVARRVAPAPAPVVWDMGNGEEATVHLGNAYDWLLAATWRAQHRPLLYRAICRELTTLTAVPLHGAAYPWHRRNSLSAPAAAEGGIPGSSLALLLHSEATGLTPRLQHATQLLEIVEPGAENEEGSGPSETGAKTKEAVARSIPEPSKDPALAALLLSAYQQDRWGGPNDVAAAAGRATAMVEAFPQGYAVCHISTAASGASSEPGGPASSVLAPGSQPGNRQPQLVVTRASAGRPVIHALLPAWSPGSGMTASGAGESADNAALLQEPQGQTGKKGPGRRGPGQGRGATSVSAAAAVPDVGVEDAQQGHAGSVAVEDVLGRFGALMEDSDSSMKGVKDKMGRAEMEHWWTWRLRLDKEMQQLVSDMELSLLGPWVCLLLGEPLDATVPALCEQHAESIWATLTGLSPPNSSLSQEDTAAAAQGGKPRGTSTALDNPSTRKKEQDGGPSDQGQCMGREMIRLLLQAHAMSVIADKRLLEGLLDVAEAQSRGSSTLPQGAPAAWPAHERSWRKGAEETLPACIASFKAATAGLPGASGVSSGVGVTGEDEPLAKRGRGQASGKARAAASKEAGAGDAMHMVHQPVQLILDSTIQCLPWECMPSLLTQRVYRAASLSAMRALLLHHRSSAAGSQAQRGAGTKAAVRRKDSADRGSNGVGLSVDPLATFYVVNPGADLKNTQKEFESWFQSLPTWKGKSGCAPSAEEFKTALDACSLFVYCGHGSGEQYFKASSLHKLRTRCPATLLMGCSSGRLRPRGDYEPVGVPLHYVTAGCPALLGNLWDVTDKDIDGFCRRVLEGWLGEGKGQADEPLGSGGGSKAASKAGAGAGRVADDSSGLAFVLPDAASCVSSAVATQRSGCKMRYLIGAAVVCYGMPASVLLHSYKEAAS